MRQSLPRGKLLADAITQSACKRWGKSRRVLSKMDWSFSWSESVPMASDAAEMTGLLPQQYKLAPTNRDPADGADKS